VFTDAAGEAVIISEDLFKDYKGNWKIGKGSRSQDLILLAEAIKNPDEIWVSMMWHRVKKKSVSSRAYLSRYTIDKKQYIAVAVWDYVDGWHGVTAHTSLSAGDFSRKVEKNRAGIRLFRRSL